MKKGYFFLLISLFINMSLIAQDNIAEYTISQFSNDELHNNLKVKINYSKKTDEVYLSVDARKSSKFLILDKSERSEIIEILKKALRWEKKAKEKKAVFKKEIGKIDLSGGFKYGAKYHFDFSNNVTLNFSGDKKESKYTSLIYFRIPKMVASNNKYIDINSHIVFLESDGINELIYGLTTAIEDYKKEMQKESKIADEFN